jgi:hypothetical protein
MLIPIVDIPSSASLTTENTTELLTFISHIGILGPILLRVSDIAVEHEVAALQLVESATALTACYIDGLTFDNDDLATKLLDKGARILLFKATSEIELQATVMKSLPRNRVGLNCTGEVITISKMLETVNAFREYSEHFLFRYDIAEVMLLCLIAFASVIESQ